MLAIFRQTALHEVLHLVLSDLTACAHDRFIGEHEIKEANEKAVVRLTNALWELLEPVEDKRSVTND